LLFSTRDPATEGDLAGLPGLAVEGLTDHDARALLASVIPGPLDKRVRDRIIAESGGNPLALLELPHGLTAADLADGIGRPGAGPLPLAGRIEQSFTMGAEGFAERTGRELLAAGERVRKRTTQTPAQLTARETEIARLAGTGLSNPEIAAELVMSPRTVEYHLHKVFTKLGVNSRNRLHGVLASSDATERSRPGSRGAG
jgi:DNA-binding CsgD family transcriptional regulator